MADIVMRIIIYEGKTWYVLYLSYLFRKRVEVPPLLEKNNLRYLIIANNYHGST